MSLVQTEKGLELTHLRKGAVGRGLAPAEASPFGRGVAVGDGEGERAVEERQMLKIYTVGGDVLAAARSTAALTVHRTVIHYRGCRWRYLDAPKRSLYK